jgi:hypothetical protein
MLAAGKNYGVETGKLLESPINTFNPKNVCDIADTFLLQHKLDLIFTRLSCYLWNHKRLPLLHAEFINRRRQKTNVSQIIMTHGMQKDSAKQCVQDKQFFRATLDKETQQVTMEQTHQKRRG